MSEQNPDPNPNKDKDERTDIDLSKLYDHEPDSSPLVVEGKNSTSELPPLPPKPKDFPQPPFGSGYTAEDKRVQSYYDSTGVRTAEVVLTGTTSKPSFTLYIDPGEADAKDIADLYMALNDLYQHFGGSQLKFVNNGTKVIASEEEYA